jgi:hypothetical protein
MSDDVCRNEKKKKKKKKKARVKMFFPQVRPWHVINRWQEGRTPGHCSLGQDLICVDQDWYV